MVTPLKVCFGGLSLFIGVLIVCFLHMIMNVLLLCVSSSVEAAFVGNIKIAPFWQICASSWALLGNPLIVVAAVGSMFRIAWPLKVYLYYLVVTVVITFVFITEIFYAADVCGSTVPMPVRKLGEHFVCSASNTLVFSLILMSSGFSMYAIWVVWSCEMSLSDPDGHMTLMRAEEIDEEEVEDNGVREKFHFSPLDQTAYKWVDPTKAQMQGAATGKAPISQHLGGYGAYGSTATTGAKKSSFGAFY